MAKQTINLGTAPSGSGGDTPRSAFTKLQANDDELYAKVQSNNDALYAKPWIAAVDAPAVRAALSLGTAALAAIGKGTGNILAVGTSSFGLGVEFEPGFQLLTSTESIEIYKSGFYRYNSATVGRPTFGSGFGALIELSTYSTPGANWGVQIVIDYAVSEMGFRSLSGTAGFSAWRKIYHDGNTTRAADGTLKAI